MHSLVNSSQSGSGGGSNGNGPLGTKVIFSSGPLLPFCEPAIAIATIVPEVSNKACCDKEIVPLGSTALTGLLKAYRYKLRSLAEKHAGSSLKNRPATGS